MTVFPPTQVTLGPGREFASIARWVRQWGARAHGIGDDAAILDVPGGTRLVVSTDTTTEDVHFRRAWLSAREIGWRAAMAALSDLAAMGADPLGVLIALGAPASWDGALDDVLQGVGDACAAAKAPIIGGDTTRAPVLTLSITVLGTAVEPMRRDGARPGDTIYVTGSLGGPGAALQSWLKGAAPRATHRARFAKPVARLGMGAWCARNGASAAIDLSDGLVADAGHVAAASGVRLSIELASVPILGGVLALEALASGEEYELLLTGPAGMAAAAKAARIGSLTPIGLVMAATPTEPAGVVVHDGPRRVDPPAGYDHLSPQ
ncbi:MAG: thiamine-phosphate kinase [Gemmatimonadaceae bacterium]|nr:thiamine-phosphate kinase [Gemmatimonadaceae bacterium]